MRCIVNRDWASCRISSAGIMCYLSILLLLVSCSTITRGSEETEFFEAYQRVVKAENCFVPNENYPRWEEGVHTTNVQYSLFLGTLKDLTDGHSHLKDLNLALGKAANGDVQARLLLRSAFNKYGVAEAVLYLADFPMDRDELIRLRVAQGYGGTRFYNWRNP